MKVTQGFSIDYEIFKRFTEMCRAKKINRSAVVSSLIEHWMQHQDGAPAVETMLHDPERD